MSELRATSDALLLDLERLSALEQEKRTVTPDDPRLVELAARVEHLAERVLKVTARQRRLSAEAHREAQGDPEAPQRSIEETPRPIHAILAEWREAERRLVSLDRGSDEAAEMTAHVSALRSEYRAAHEAARAGSRSSRRSEPKPVDAEPEVGPPDADAPVTLDGGLAIDPQGLGGGTS